MWNVLRGRQRLVFLNVALALMTDESKFRESKSGNSPDPPHSFVDDCHRGSFGRHTHARIYFDSQSSLMHLRAHYPWFMSAFPEQYNHNSWFKSAETFLHVIRARNSRCDDVVVQIFEPSSRHSLRSRGRAVGNWKNHIHWGLFIEILTSHL